MTLPERLRERIRANGALTLEDYWNLALFDREGGYYMRAEPFGRGGDFTTAPEISQMFGELIGIWIVSAWARIGRPNPFLLVEIGPGRGTLMGDILRTLRSVEPACLAAARVRLVETSERLAALQATALERFDLPVARLRRIEEAEALPAIVVANELLDALPIRQFLFDGALWRERLVGLAPDERLVFGTAGPQAAFAMDHAALALPAPKRGDILEISPAREAMTAAIGHHLSAHGGTCLLIDYGHAEPGYGDTLQALRAHAHVDPLEEPGLADITSHVDFAATRRGLEAAGLHASPIATQAEFLLSLGLIERAGALGAGRNAEEQDAIRAAVERLAGNGERQMGTLFKVLAAAAAPLSIPPFAASSGG